MSGKICLIVVNRTSGAKILTKTSNIFNEFVDEVIEKVKNDIIAVGGKVVDIVGNTTNRSDFARILFKRTNKVYKIFIKGTETNHEEYEINFSKRISLDKAKDRVREEFQKICINKLVRIMNISEKNLKAMFRIQKLNEK